MLGAARRGGLRAHAAGRYGGRDPGGGFAGPAKVREAARLGCAERFAEESRDPYSHDFTIQALYPVTRTEWEKGRRTVVCWASAKGLFQEGRTG
ncbi:hypothetical protein NQP46_08285 [Streptomyces albus]|nr:hypothetical protein NQP46_08285 [Streptomyces albus]